MRRMNRLGSMIALVTAAVPAAAQDVREVEPAAVRLAAGSPAVTVLLRGSGLDALTAARVVRNGAPVRDITAEAEATRDGRSRGVRIAAGSSAAAGYGYALEVSSARLRSR